MLEESTGNFSASRNMYDWFQTTSHVILNVMIKNLKETDVKVRLIDETLDVTCSLADGSEFNLHFDLFKPIYVAESNWTVSPSKLEIKLKKTDRKRWQSLEVLPDKGAAKRASNSFPCTNLTAPPQQSPLKRHNQDMRETEMATTTVEAVEVVTFEGEGDGEECQNLETTQVEDAEITEVGPSEEAGDQLVEEIKTVVYVTTKEASSSPSHSSTSAKRQPKNWDKIVNEFEEEEKKTKADGSVDELFREIYMKGGEEVRRAMNKSFIESAGTVLSTNWDQVAKDKVDVKPPEGCDFKKWDT